MEVAMLDLIVGIGIVLVLLLLLKLLEYFDLFDILELFGAVAKLVTGAIAVLAALLLWSARKIAGSNETAKPAADQNPPVRRSDIRGRTFARHGRRGPTT
jgi:hypothetical protein